MIGLSGCATKELARLPGRDSKELVEVLNLRNILQGSSGRILPLLELCFRKVHCFVRSVSVEKLSSLELPSHVTTLLAAPTGHCFVCDSSYFTAVFLQEESTNTALRITSAEIFQGLRDTTCSFAFCCCSRSCLDEVSRLHDIPD